MASLFMNPSECGPVNDLKSLGNRIDVDGRARRDGFHANASGSSRNVHKPFQALPQASGFNITSPNHPSAQTRPIRPAGSNFPQAPAFFPPPHLNFPLASHGVLPSSSFPQAQPRSTDSSAWAQSYNPTAGVRPSGASRPVAQSTSAWAQEHLGQQIQTQPQRSHAQQSQLGDERARGSSISWNGVHAGDSMSLGGAGFRTGGWNQTGLHGVPIPMPMPMPLVNPMSMGYDGSMMNHHHAQHDQPHASVLDPTGAFTSYAPISEPIQTHPDSDLRQTAKEILENPAVKSNLSSTQEGDLGNPFASSEFFKLMQDLALNGGESLGSTSKLQQRGADDQVQGEEQQRETEERSNCFFGGFDDGIQEGTEVTAHLSSGLNLDHAVPTTAQPVFDTDGRWVPFHRARAFKESKMNVPDQVRRALEEVEEERYRRARVGGEREEGMREQEEEDGFDTEGLMEFYGQARVRSGDGSGSSGSRMAGNALPTTAIGRERQAAREHLERGLTGTTGRETDELLGFTESQLDRVLLDKRTDEMRSQGYGQDRRKYEMVGLEGQYLFVSGNPFVKGRQGEHTAGRLDEERAGMMEMQYQNLLEHEARVLDDPESSRAWFDLALKQQELERDDQAIRALLQCIALDPDCKEAYLALSVSYTNEGMIREGHSVLERWVSGGGKIGQDSDTGRLDLGQNKLERHRILTKELMRMARMMPEGDIDADVQVALGVLFNASEEYDKAQDCFRAALFARQDDWMLYNRLGATLANGGRSEEALQYYEQALALNPGYVRARFNVGISLIKLARYREAAIYILDAIRLQHADASSNAQSVKSVTSDILWTTLATTCMHLDRHDLMDACNARHLDVLEQEFQEYK